MGLRALVLSGGGMFGAWQAGAWSVIAEQFQPELIVGASVGAMNGYAIASGWTPKELSGFWQQEEEVGFEYLERTAQMLTNRALQKRYAVVLVDLFRMTPRTYCDTQVTWNHLVASCAVPGVMPPRRIDGRLYLDGGLLNPLPLWAAVELGATEIVALHALPDVPSVILKPLAKAFRFVFGYQPPLPADVSVSLLVPGCELGTMMDAVRWKQDNIVRWLEQGRQDAKNISIPKCIER